MNKIAKISNPMLIGAMELLKKNNTPANLKIFVDEMMHATFLSPVVITPKPEKDENGRAKLTPDSKVSVPMFTLEEGKRYFGAFTDLGEMKKIQSEAYVSVLPFTFKDYAGMVAKSDESCQGFVINPYNGGMVISKSMIAAIVGKPANEQAGAAQSEEVQAEAVQEEVSQVEASSVEAQE